MSLVDDQLAILTRYIADTGKRIEEQLKLVQRTAAAQDGDAKAQEVLAAFRDSLFLLESKKRGIERERSLRRIAAR